MVARSTVARLMRALGFRGVERGWRVKTTTPVAKPAYPANRVNRVFRATRRNAQQYVADPDGRGNMGRIRLPRVRHQRLRAVNAPDALVHYGNRRAQYFSICYTEPLAEADIERSVRSVDDLLDDIKCGKYIVRLQMNQAILQLLPRRRTSS